MQINRLTGGVVVPRRRHWRGRQRPWSWNTRGRPRRRRSTADDLGTYGHPRRRWSSADELGDARTFPMAAEQRRWGRGRWGATHGGKRGWWTRGEGILRGPCGGHGTTTWEAWPSVQLGQDLADEEGRPLLWGRR
jgi:hypothetical protein